ncbi:unnamed protein product [Arabis nemorensis]|uniref:DUF287 domain-containing protein n=1 Tax=Arabis nemorensis TaxID=586526 RepID=A0A565ARQ5_9BRAS|nr:unnamed protein product [Arabis nemorensis]
MYDLDVHAQIKEAANKEAVEEEGAEEEGAEEEVDNVEEEVHLVSNDEVEKLKKDMLDLQEGMLKINKSMEDEGSKDCEGESSKDSEEEGDEDKGEEGEEGEKDEVVGQKRTRKPSDVNKSPYTTMTEEKKRKKVKSKKD